MKSVKFLSMVLALSAAFTSLNAHADMVSDAHGNVGYDTAAECDAAVLAGTAKFYQSFTHKTPLKRAGETDMTTATIRDLGEGYAKGACDVGTGRRMGRDGVSTALQGKYIPFSPDMPVNVYMDANGKAVRVTMAQCDNWFAENAPRAVELPKPVAKTEEPAPVEKTAPTNPVAAAVAAVAAVPKAIGIRPYVFGTLGAINNKVDWDESSSISKNRFAGQAGVGVQFNDWVGLEGFYQGARRAKGTDELGLVKWKQQGYGARVTVGNNVADRLRLFGKVGAARIDNKLSVFSNDAEQKFLEDAKENKTRVTAGVGATYNLNDNLAIRADYDHYFKKSKQDVIKGVHYLGAGLQYKF